jgi:hypothetical protein
MSDPVSRLGLQRLNSKAAQTLVVAQLAALRNPGGWFAPREIKELFEQLRVPAPGNLAQEMSRLAARGELLKRDSLPPWSLTAVGEHRVMELMGEISDAPSMTRTGVELEGGRHQFIPPGLAPRAWVPALTRLGEKFPFERNIFLITRYPTRPDDPLKEVINRAESVCEAHGFNLLRADGTHADPLLPNNVFAHMWASQYGLALLEEFGDPPRKAAALNYNVIFELGSMLMLGRRCAIVKDAGVEDKSVPSDMSAHIRHTASFADPDATEAAFHDALVKDFGSPHCSYCSGSR